jgi:hypothetical protein
LPADVNTRLVEIPIVDSSTKVWHDSRDDMVKNLKSLDPAKYMIETNVELATRSHLSSSNSCRKYCLCRGSPFYFIARQGRIVPGSRPPSSCECWESRRRLLCRIIS